MERNVSMMMKRLAIFFALALGAAASWPTLAGEQRLVLVASANSPAAKLSPAEVRRLYLGVPVVQDGHEIVPLCNSVEPIIHEVFLQRVLFMSARAYERQGSARIYRTGGNRIRDFASFKQLLDALANDPWSVTYMSLESASGMPSIKIVADL